ncbi:MAG: shikimate dehydrogenase [Anaerolineae bacterium]|nr:shikimate dehydrogenase [Anaerolineae bacterium]
MDSFAFVIHPIDPKRDVERKFPLLGRYLSIPLIHFLSRFFPPLYISHIVGVRSILDKEIEGWFVACPFTPDRMVSLPARVVYRKIVRTGKLAQKLGAKILGLGAFTSVIGDAGITIASRLDIPVTTGNSYTVAVATQAARAAAQQMEIDLHRATVAVVGATGAVGSVSSQLLARECGKMILIGRKTARLEEVKAKIAARHSAPTYLSSDVSAIGEADIIIAVTSSLDAVIEPQHLRPGAVVLDVARPRDVSKRVVQERDDVLVIEGGMVKVPGPALDFGFDFGFPPRMAFACMAEVMILALEHRYASYTLGRDITIEQVEEIEALGIKHGFELGGFRCFERAVTDQDIERVRQAVHTRDRS